MTNPYSRSTSKPMRNGVGPFDTAFTEIPCGNSACGIQIFVFAVSVSPTANVKPTSVVSIVVSSYRSAGWTLKPDTVFVAPPSQTANLSRLHAAADTGFKGEGEEGGGWVWGGSNPLPHQTPNKFEVWGRVTPPQTGN